MAAMTSRFNIRCVIQYNSDQWAKHEYINIIDRFSLYGRAAQKEGDKNNNSSKGG